MIKPKALKSGDRIATVTLSWGGPAVFPHRYKAGKQQLKEAFGVEVVEMEHTLASADWIAANPKARAQDLMAAFADDSIDAIVSTIGGNDSIRILPFLDLDLIAENPKPFIGYSDTTVSHLACYKAGLVSFYGPAIMSGFAENCGLHPYLEQSFRKVLFADSLDCSIVPNTEGWTVEHLDWAKPENQNIKRKLNPAPGWNFLQGGGVYEGHLLGGCLEVLEWLRGTPVWPTPEQWKGAFLFLETSEEGPLPDVVISALRSYAAEGVLSNLSGILFARPGGDVKPDCFVDYDKAILQVVCEEEGLTDLAVITGMDFGHTDPFLTLPYGIIMQADFDRKALSLKENAVSS